MISPMDLPEQFQSVKRFVRRFQIRAPILPLTDEPDAARDVRGDHEVGVPSILGHTRQIISASSAARESI